MQMYIHMSPGKCSYVDEVDATVWQLFQLLQIVTAVNHPRVDHGRGFSRFGCTFRRDSYIGHLSEAYMLRDLGGRAKLGTRFTAASLGGAPANRRSLRSPAAAGLVGMTNIGGKDLRPI